LPTAISLAKRKLNQDLLKKSLDKLAIDLKTTINVNKSSFCVSTSLVRNFRIAICEISCIEDHLWYINRCLVPESMGRGKGIGSSLLQSALQTILEIDPIAKIIVQPGGYNSDPDRQINFYTGNGFVLSESGEHYEFLG